MKILLATSNPGKVREIAAFFGSDSVDFLSLADVRLAPPPETGESFAENATMKALVAARKTGLITLAEDSGLTVDALDGAPGVRSARFAGEEADDEANNRALLAALEGVPPKRRGAAFCCAMALAIPPESAHLLERMHHQESTHHPERTLHAERTRLSGAVHLVEGRCEGRILTAPRGRNGFGYDPLFFVPALGRTFAELSVAEKEAHSHRGAALRKMRDLLDTLGIISYD